MIVQVTMVFKYVVGKAVDRSILGLILWSRKVDVWRENCWFKIIYNGIEVKQFDFNENVREQYRNKLNVNDMFVAGYVGRFLQK